MKTNYDKLEKEINIFGVLFYGDGSMIKKFPLINFLASGAHIPTLMIEIVDCSRHLGRGGKKC
jgi:hypothetical protein